jgi:hypothetical protein
LQLHNTFFWKDKKFNFWINWWYESLNKRRLIGLIFCKKHLTIQFSDKENRVDWKYLDIVTFSQIANQAFKGRSPKEHRNRVDKTKTSKKVNKESIVWMFRKVCLSAYSWSYREAFTVRVGRTNIERFWWKWTRLRRLWKIPQRTDRSPLIC